MNYGLYLSASGVLAHTYRQDVFANNLANVQTTAFKPNLPAVSHRQSESLEDPTEFDLRQDLLDRLGGGTLAGPQRVSFSVGSPTKTGGQIDAMLPIRDQFFQVRDDQGQVKLTRDGRFALSSDGTVVTTAGHAVLNPQGQPIVLPADADVHLDPQGRFITAAGDEAGVLGMVSVVSPESNLEKQGENLFAPAPGAVVTPVATRQIQPGYVEASAVNAVQTLTQLISATKAAMGNANMIRYHDLVMDRAINTLGRVRA